MNWKSQMKSSSYGLWILRLLVGGGFVIAGALKIAAPGEFAIAVGNYRLLPGGLINVTAILVPWVEVVTGLFILTGIWLRTASLIIVCMTALFAGVIISALARGLNIECGCFGTVGGRHIGLVNLAIDLVFFCLAASLAWKAGRESGGVKFQWKQRGPEVRAIS
jgi:putative oxidoreductase